MFPFAGTTEVATLLGISAQRVRVLLKENRIMGAYKINGKTWVIPLFDGMPIISGKKRGPKPRWHSRQHCGKKTVHVNRNNLRDNQTNGNTKKKVASIKQGSKNLATGHEVEIHGPCRIVYRREKPHSCGATVWIETFAAVTVYDFEGNVERVNSMWELYEDGIRKSDKQKVEELIRIA